MSESQFKSVIVSTSSDPDEDNPALSRRRLRLAADLFRQEAARGGQIPSFPPSSPPRTINPADQSERIESATLPVNPPAPKQVWLGLVVELAQKIATEYKHLTPEKRIERFGKAPQAAESSLSQAFVWAAEHYIQKNGKLITAHSLANVLYQKRYPKSKS